MLGPSSAHRLIAFSTLVAYATLSVGSAFGSEPSLLDENKRNLSRGQAEYFNANKERRFEVTINLVSGVQAPGIYHLPDSTNLLEAISLAGGTVPDADLSKVHVKRTTENGTFQTFQYDLSEIVSEKNVRLPAISDRDTILIETTNRVQNTMLRLAIISIILGVITTAAAVSQARK